MTILNFTLKELHEYMLGHKVICFGAGIQGQRWAYIIEDWGCCDKLLGFIDNDMTKHGSNIESYSHAYPIMSLDDAVDMTDGNTFILITSLYCESMMRDIQHHENKRDIKCASVTVTSENQLMISDYPCVVKESEEPIIPKKIHYAWVGADMPDAVKKNVDTWHKYCPDYEIKCWNETNYDVTKNEYMYQAYQSRAWGFVTDYLRLDVVWNEGGIYIDTDVEMIKKPDEILYQSCFGVTDASFMMNLGSGFGAVAHCGIIKELRDYYDNVSFVGADGKPDKTTCNTHNYHVMRKYGFKVDDSRQRVGDMNVYPMIANGVDAYTHKIRVTDKTFWIHHGNMSWYDKKL